VLGGKVDLGHAAIGDLSDDGVAYAISHQRPMEAHFLVRMPAARRDWPGAALSSGGAPTEPPVGSFSIGAGGELG